MSTKYPSKLPPASDGKTPHVMIVGAGIGGLYLAILLEKAGISYEIFERAKVVRPLGSIMSLSANILPSFEQIGLYEELRAISIQGSHHNSNIMYDDMEIIAALPDPNLDGAIGYEFHLFPRPALHSLLLSKVPPERIHYSKKVLSIQQNKEGVMIRCADDTTYHGDILVGADGAYSGVRQSLYKSLKDSNQLPPSDGKEISKGYICLLGTTDPLDPAEYPLVARENCTFSQVIGRGTAYSWAEFNVPDNRICWFVVYQLANEAESEEIKFRNSEWGPEFHGHMIEAVKGFRLPSGTLGNLINHTPRDNISRVFLEDKVYRTWTHGRTVLIGDAAHKLLPSAGQGAVCAMQDAVILTNCLYDLKSLAPESIQEALQDFKSQRYPHVKKQFQASKLMAIFLNGQTLVERIIRKIAFNWMPSSIKDASMRKDAAYRPQLNFMPLAPTREYTAPKVLIAGAGIGGLYLAILLDKARIPYEIYERASKVKPLGSIMSLSANILASIEQIGLYEELKAISIQGSHHQSNIMYDNLDIIAALPDPNLDGAIGYEFHLFPRPDLHKLLLSKVPAERIHYDKDVVSVAEDKDGVHITCADGSTYKGDLLVGADGAYSGVRQSLFKTLKEENLLPPSDEQELPKGYICLVGTSDPLNPEEYPFVAKENCVFSQVIGRGTNYSWAEFNVPDNRVCWFVVEQLNSQAEADAVKFRNPEWKSELNDEAIKVVREFRLPGGRTIGNMIDHTPKDSISRVFLEDKLFLTWTHGRTVLIGDAAHKLLPSGGMGAVCAMQDAVILTNCLYDLKSLSLESIKEALQDYKSQRQPHVEQQVEASRTMQMLLSGQTYFERFVRYIVFHWIPASIKNSTIKKDAAYRPQSSFLPLAPKRGTIDILPQKPSRRHEEEHGQHKEP